MPTCGRNPDQLVIPERRWVLLKIPRCDKDGVGEVTVTSRLHRPEIKSEILLQRSKLKVTLKKRTPLYTA